MRIAFLHFHTLRLLRGIETLVLSLSNELVKLGHDVSVLTAKGTTQPLIALDKRTRLIAYTLPRYFAYHFIGPQYALHLVKNPYDAVIVFFADFGEALAWKLARRFVGHDTRLITYLCYPYSAVPHRYLSMVRARFFEQSALVLADARYVAADASSIVRRTIEVVPVGTDPVRFRPDPLLRETTRRRLGYTDDQIVLLNVSALEARKGPRRVIDVLPDLLRRMPNLRYLILGIGADEAHLRRVVTEHHLERVVEFGGTTTELPAYYNAADLFVMLPDNEANSVASHEALACGLPILASNSGGFCEVMKPEFASLVDPNDRDAIKSTLTTLCTTPELRQRMSVAGRSYAEQHLTWAASALVLDRLLRSLK